MIKEIPGEYGYKDIYDKDNLIMTKFYLEESSETFLFNVNTGTLNNFIKSTKSENYIADIKCDANWILWLECTKTSEENVINKKHWSVFAKNINDNEVFMLTEGVLNSYRDLVPIITINNGMGTLTVHDTTSNEDKLFLLDLKSKSIKEIYNSKSKKEAVFNLYNVTSSGDKIIWCEAIEENSNVEEKYNIYYYDLKKNEKKLLPFNCIDYHLGIYDEYIVFNVNGSKINLFNCNNSKMVNITETDMDIFKNKIGLTYTKCFRDSYMSKDYIYFRCEQVNNTNAFIYDINENIYYSILNKFDSENYKTNRFYCKDNSMILKYSNESKNIKSFYVLLK